MRPTSRQRRALFQRLGKIVTQWNELEFKLRTVLIQLAPHPTTAIMLTADLQIVPLMNAIRYLAIEEDANSELTNKIAQKMIGTSKGKAKFRQPVRKHVDHLIDYVDLLREYRNYYVHGAVRADSSNQILVIGITFRQGMRQHHNVIAAAQLAWLSKEIVTVVKFAEKLLTNMERNKSTSHSERATWPKIRALPAKLAKPHTNWRDTLLQHHTSSE